MHINTSAVLLDLRTATRTWLANLSDQLFRLPFLLSTSTSVFGRRFIAAEGFVPVTLAEDTVLVVAGGAGEDVRVAGLRRLHEVDLT